MSRHPTMLPCAKCHTPEYLDIYQYETSLMKHVECDKCFYLGPGSGSVRGAIQLHNARMIEIENSAVELRQVLSDALAKSASTGGEKT